MRAKIQVRTALGNGSTPIDNSQPRGPGNSTPRRPRLRTTPAAGAAYQDASPEARAWSCLTSDLVKPILDSLEPVSVYDAKTHLSRLLIAQATVEGLAIVTRDRVFADYGVAVVWE